jgi:hypothetical protein
MTMPTGDDAQTAQAYYDYLTAHALAAQAAVAPRTEIIWAGPLAIVFFAAILILFFMLYSLYFQQRTRRHDELYGVVSFGGKILERAGGIPIFERVVWGGVVIYALYVTVTDILFGQIY